MLPEMELDSIFNVNIIQCGYYYNVCIMYNKKKYLKEEEEEEGEEKRNPNNGKRRGPVKRGYYMGTPVKD